MIGKRNSVPTEAELEVRIKTEIDVIKKTYGKKKLPREEIESLYKKHENIYRISVLNGSSTTESYVYKEAFRRYLEEYGK